jgi:hypothetical protein
MWSRLGLYILKLFRDLFRPQTVLMTLLGIHPHHLSVFALICELTLNPIFIAHVVLCIAFYF